MILTRRHLTLLLLALSPAPGCAITHPCAEAGDTSWLYPIKGNKQCEQRKLADGRWVNEGKFVQYYLSGKTALEGQFKEGKKDGAWTQYDETGKKTVEKTYADGVEVSAPAPPPAKR